jgi:hypothetical protein
MTAATEAPRILLDNVSVSYQTPRGRLRIVDRLSLAVDKAEFVVLVNRAAAASRRSCAPSQASTRSRAESSASNKNGWLEVASNDRLIPRVFAVLPPPMLDAAAPDLSVTPDLAISSQSGYDQGNSPAISARPARTPFVEGANGGDHHAIAS